MAVNIHKTRAALSVRLLAVSIAICFVVGCSASAKKTNTTQLRHNQPAVTALNRELALSRHDQRYSAVLRGVRWCATFCDRDQNFRYTFSDYITMLDELTLTRSHPALNRIVHELLLSEFQRAIPRFRRLFPANANGYENFISILPTAYRHHVPLETLKEFAATQFTRISPIDYFGKFRKTAKKLDYDRLTDMIIGATFADMAYQAGAAKHFRLPRNNYQAIMDECTKIPFLRTFGDNTYSDQNYFATHVVLALNHYGRLPLKTSATYNHAFQYLQGQYETVRHRVGDIDLLCEYLYCFRMQGGGNAELIAEGERYIMSRQHADGSWGTADDFSGTPYDKLHPTWTAITLLVQDDDHPSGSR